MSDAMIACIAAPVDRYARFLARLPGIRACRQHDEDWQLYELLKQDLARECPDLDPARYDAAISAIARAAGV